MPKGEAVGLIERPARFASIMEQVDFELTLERIAAAAARGWRLRYTYGVRGFRFIARQLSGCRCIGQAMWDKRAALKSVLNGIEDEHALMP